MVLSVILLVSGVVVYGKLLRAQAISSGAGNLNREIAEGVAPTRWNVWREAGAGIEPANSGFADRDLTTWLPRHFTLVDGCFSYEKRLLTHTS